MSLAASISDQLNGHQSGNSFVVPAICHSPDSAGRNLQISDGLNGRLSAFCHSNGCNYREIMEALESRGLKPLDTLNPQQKRQAKTKFNRNETLRLLDLEMFVLTRFIDSRLSDLAKTQDREYLKFHPEFKAMPAELWPREIEAIERINYLTGQLK